MCTHELTLHAASLTYSMKKQHRPKFQPGASSEIIVIFKLCSCASWQAAFIASVLGPTSPGSVGVPIKCKTHGAICSTLDH